jgi:hypothetical protein
MHVRVYQHLVAAVSGFFIRRLKKTAEPNETRHVQEREGCKSVATGIKVY